MLRAHHHDHRNFWLPLSGDSLFIRFLVDLIAVLLAALFIALALSMTVQAAPQDKKEQVKLREYGKDMKEVLELKDYGVKKWLSKSDDEADFKADVWRAYTELRRNHQKQAFRVNTRPPLRVMGDLEGEGGNFAARSTGAGAATEGAEALYDNPMLQDYISRIGHSLVPPNSRKLYAFRILQDPLPRAEALSTGTIYISTGLLGMLDNEAQLSYILSHEIAHVEAEHWFYQAMLPVALEEKNADKEKKRQRIGMLAAIGGIALGAKGGVDSALQAGNAAYGLGTAISGMFIRDLHISEWNIADEDEADRFAFANCLARSYDVQEIPKLFVNLQTASIADQRAGLGFMSSLQHVFERNEAIKVLLAANDTTIRSLASQGKLMGSHSDFEVLMAELKRDNGVVAFYYDMFDMCRRNLEWALRIRSDDAKIHYYLGRVLKLTAKTPAERERALREFTAALKLDETRGALPGIRLQQALSLMDLRDPNRNTEIATYIKEYVRLYKLNNAGHVPPNMDIMYDYLTQAGDKSWFVPPTNNISTQDVPPVTVQGMMTQPPPSVPSPSPSPKPPKPKPQEE